MTISESLATHRRAAPERSLAGILIVAGAVELATAVANAAIVIYGFTWAREKMKFD